jgi:hypothetical protein
VLRDPALIRALVAVWRLPVVKLRVRQADVDAWSGVLFGSTLWPTTWPATLMKRRWLLPTLPCWASSRCSSACSATRIGTPASRGRYQLHTSLALDLGCSGIKHLLAGSALREPVGNQNFQHLLGYRARNLRVEVIESAVG